MIAARTPPRLLTLILLSALSVLPVSMFLPSLSNMAAALRADYELVSLAVAGYAAGTAILQLALGPLSDRFGRRPVLLVAVLVFTIASLGCALATDIGSFLAFRLLQGVVIAGYSVSLAVIRDVAPPRQAASLIGYTAAAWAVAPMLGPLMGGMLDEVFGWRASFLVLAGLGAAVLALCWLDLGETNRGGSGAAATQFGAYVELLRSPRFWGYTLCMAFSTGSFYAFLGGIPLVAPASFGLSPAALGLAMGTMTVGFMLGSALSGRFARLYPLTATMIAGRIVACCGLLAGLALLGLGIRHVTVLFGPCVLVGVGNGLTMPGASAGAISVRPSLAGSASGLSGSVTVAGGAVMSWISGRLVAHVDGPGILLAVMLGSSLAALLAALWVGRSGAYGPRTAARIG